MPFTNFGANRLLDVFRGQAIVATQFYVGLLTTLPTDRVGAGLVEANYAGYARQRVDLKLSAASGSAIRNGAAGNEIVFAPCPTNTGLKVKGWAIWDAVSAGNLWFDTPAMDSQRSFSALASTDVFTAPGHDLNNGQPVRFVDIDASNLPTGLNTTTTYYVVNTNQAAGTFQVSASEGGAAIDITTNGNGIIQSVTELPLATNVQIQFAVNQLSISVA